MKLWFEALRKNKTNIEKQKSSRNEMRIENKIKPLELMWPEQVHLVQKLHRHRLDCSTAEQVVSIRSFRHRIVRIFSNIENHRNRLPQSNCYPKVPHRSRPVLYSAMQSVIEYNLIVTRRNLWYFFFLRWNSPKSRYQLPDHIVRLCRFANSRLDC